MMRLKSFIVLCLIALCSVTQAKEFTYKSVKGDPMATRIYTLDNGLTVYLSVNHEKPRIQTCAPEAETTRPRLQVWHTILST